MEHRSVECSTLKAINYKLKAQPGFTLLEVVLVIAIFGILIAATTTAITRFEARNDLDLAVTTGVDVLRLAEERARAADGDAQWGVKFATGTVTLFQGLNYASRNVAFDEATQFGSAITASDTTEFDFTRLMATTTTVGTTTLTNPIINESRTINVSAKGTINY